MSKENIPGIYNYCDRWCERCTFTSRCSLYAQENESPEEDIDIRNREFWDRLSSNFVKAKDMLEEAAKKSGIDLTAIQFDKKESEKQEEKLRKRSSNHPAGKLSLEYSDFVRQWLKTQPGMLDRLEKIKEDLTLGIESEKAAKEQIETIRDSIAVIEWYSTFIHIKLMRALMGKSTGDIFEDDPDSARDYDGSAKIALIAVERSMQAWLNLFELLPAQEDHFLKVLSLLEKIKSETRKEFPEAANFVRPGFDQGD